MVFEHYPEDDVGSYAGHSVSAESNEEIRISLEMILGVIHLRTVNHR
jgi:hypothetical protein